MIEIDLKEEPVSIVVTEDPQTNVISFADVIERMIPALEKTYGPRIVQSSIQPTDIAKRYFSLLDEEPAREPRFLSLFRSGELKRRVEELEKNGPIAQKVPYFMAAVNRSDEAVFGRTGVLYFVCRKGCHFCQYRDLKEHLLDAEGIAARMIAFQKEGVDNVQWLSPTAYHRTLIKALLIAAENGFHTPILHKSEGEDSLGDLALLEGLVDIYVPDVKFIRPEFAPVIGLTENYATRVRQTIPEMYRQVGLLRRREGTHTAQSGVFVRHLVMPTGLKELETVLVFVRSIDVKFPIHLMTSYQPFHAAAQRPDINRRLTASEKAEIHRVGYDAEMPMIYISS